MIRWISALLATWIAVHGAPPVSQAAQPGQRPDAETSALVAEVRRSFTVHGKPIPPGIFFDFGDSDLADSGNIWVTVNVAAATGSNLYFDDVNGAVNGTGGWFSQKPLNGRPHAGEEISYTYDGATSNGLLVVVTRYDGGGSGRFFSLHILDLAPVRAIDIVGKPYWQINLTLLRTIPLGDRWDGEVSIAKNSIKIVTTRSGPADDGGERRTMTVLAERP
jgi:hypothetical protein